MAFTDAFEEFTLADEKAINEERGTLWAELSALARKKDFDSDDRTKSEQLQERLDNLTARRDAGLRVRAAARADKDVVDERTDRTGTGPEQYDAVFRKYLCVGLNEMQPEERTILMGRTDKEMRVQTTITGSGGGFLVPDGFWNRLVEQQKAFSPLEGVANVITTSTGADLPWLTMDDTANEGELLNEGDSVTSQDLAFGVKVLRSFTYSSKLILVSWQLIQDSAVDIEGIIARVAARRLARIHAKHFSIGDGVNKPEGITVGLTGGKAFAGAAAITYDELIDIQHILDPAYRDGNQRWMFNDATLKLIRKLVDGQGNKAWQPSLQSGIPDTILGDGYVLNHGMAGPTSGNVSVLYGNFNAGYIIRRVKGATVVRLGEKYAENLQTGYFVYDRMDGKKDDTSSYTYGIQA